ncbi:MAG: hypothetical protein PHW86_03010, partial [Candidatus Bipolaricaulis sp.]|nr:hypothetical protein [Candidatus Bipolaricaulis sp.]
MEDPVHGPQFVVRGQTADAAKLGEEYNEEAVHGSEGLDRGRPPAFGTEAVADESGRLNGCRPRGCGGELGNTDDWDDLVPQTGERSAVDGARAWKREGKLDRDHKPDGGRRPTVQRGRPDDVGLLTSDEVAFLDEGPKDPLELFADSGYITDVLNPVKSGKEATVYCCRAHPSTGRELVAAKVYAIGIGAHYRMSKIYADGRFRVYKPDSLQERAIKSGKQHGKEMVFADWV